MTSPWGNDRIASFRTCRGHITNQSLSRGKRPQEKLTLTHSDLGLLGLQNWEE